MKNKILILLITVLAFAGCKEEFLTEEPHIVSEASFYNSESGAMQGLSAAYDILQLGESVERIEFIGTVCSGDAMAGGEPGGADQINMQNMMKFQTLPSNSYTRNYWEAMYRGIYRTNILIDYMSSPIEGFDENLRLQFLGEALFLRGLFHFKLQTFFGGYPQLQSDFNNQLKGVPYVDRLLKAEEWTSISRPALDETWTGIENDFIEAAKLLRVRSELSSEEFGRATKGAAQAMLSKTYLYQEKWSDALTAAELVINSDEYHLMGGPVDPGPFTVTRSFQSGDAETQFNGYKFLWSPEANNCAEDIFSVQHYNEGSNLFPQNQEGNLVPQYYGVRAVETYNESGDLGPTEYYWGFMLPTTYFIETAYEDVGCEASDGTILDPRYSVAVVPPTGKIPYYYEDDAMRAAYPDSANFLPYHNWPSTGYATMKYFTDPIYKRTATTLGDHPQNTKYLRYADLLLIAAEAAFEDGNAAKATGYVNQVRERARLSGNTGYPQDYGTVTLEQIYAERRVELAFEGHQFYDLVRTGRANQVLTVDAMNYATMTNPLDGTEGVQQFGNNFAAGKNEIMPIPESEMDLIKNPEFTQNPGY